MAVLELQRERSLFQTPRFPSPPASPMGLVNRQTGSLDFSGCRPEILTSAKDSRSSWITLGFILVSGTVCWLVERWYCFSCKNLPTAFLHSHIPAAGSVWDLGGFVLIGVSRLIVRLGHRLNHWHKSWSRHFGHVYRHLLFIFMVVPWQSIK